MKLKLLDLFSGIGGLMAFAWFIFDVNYNDKLTINWI